jgi:spermidine/putrescine transport system substrate-binding protein
MADDAMYEKERRNAAARIDRMIMSRRQLLKKSGIGLAVMGAAPAVLAACGGGGKSASSTGSGQTTTKGASGKIDYLSWEGYDIPVKSMKAWQAKNDINVAATYIGTHDDIQAKILAGGAEGTDLITYYQGYKPLYQEVKLLTPLDESKLPNLGGMFPFWASDEGNFWVDADGTRTGVPFTFSVIGLTYDSGAIKEPSSWYDLLDPSLKGKVAAVDDPITNLTTAAHILGFDPATLTPDQASKVEDLLRKFVAQTKGISPSFGDATTLLVSGDAVAMFGGWTAMNNFAADAGKDTVRTMIPKEGSMSFSDAYAIPPTVDNVDAAHAFINQALHPKVQAQAAAFVNGGVTVKAAVPLLDKATAALYDYTALDSLFERVPMYNNPPTKSDEFLTIGDWQKRWDELKAGA